MKKLFSFGLMGWLLVSLVACGQNASSPESLDLKVEALEAQIETLKEDNEALESKLSAYESQEGLVTFVIDGDQPMVRSLSFEPNEPLEPMTLS